VHLLRSALFRDLKSCCRLGALLQSMLTLRITRTFSYAQPQQHCRVCCRFYSATRVCFSVLRARHDGAWRHQATSSLRHVQCV